MTTAFRSMNPPAVKPAAKIVWPTLFRVAALTSIVAHLFLILTLAAGWFTAYKGLEVIGKTAADYHQRHEMNKGERR